MNLVPDKNLSDLLDQMSAVYLKYITFTNEDHAFICSLWCAQTWLFATQSMHGIGTTGYLAFVSPAPECGKTAALTVTAAFSFGQPNVEVNPTSATIFRGITESKGATLVFDELDSLRDDPSLVSLLNAGYRKGAEVKRMTGKQYDKLGRFDVFCPKAFGYIRDSESIKNIRSTLESRTIRILLRRQTLKEKDLATKMRERKWRAETSPIAEKLMSWQFTVPNDIGPLLDAVDHPELGGREIDVWENLFAVAAMAGRLDEAHQKALDLIRSNREEIEDHTTVDNPILHHIAANLDTMCDEQGFSLDLAVEVLRPIWADEDEKSFMEKGVSAKRLGRILAKYGARSRKVGALRHRRIPRMVMEDVLERHLPKEEG